MSVDLERPGFVSRYPRIHLEALDRADGHSRILDLNFSTLTIDDAYVFEREIEWAITVLFQWRDLVHRMWNSAAEDAAKELVKEQLRKKRTEGTGDGG